MFERIFTVLVLLFNVTVALFVMYLGYISLGELEALLAIAIKGVTIVTMCGVVVVSVMLIIKAETKMLSLLLKD